MISTKSKEISGRMVEVSSFPFFTQLDIKMRLSKLFGTAVTKLFSGVSDGGKIPVSSVIEAAVSALSTNDVKTVQELAISLTQCTRVFDSAAGGMVSLSRTYIDTEFSGKTLEFYKICLFVIEVNFPDFFEEFLNNTMP